MQATTELDYQAHPTTNGLGPIGNGRHHGFLLQTVLALEPQSGDLLGIAHQELFLRQPAPQGVRYSQRLKRERESQVWELDTPGGEVAVLTLEQCVKRIAQSGGYQGRRSDGPPGWKT